MYGFVLNSSIGGVDVLSLQTYAPFSGGGWLDLCEKEEEPNPEDYVQGDDDCSEKSHIGNSRYVAYALPTPTLSTDKPYNPFSGESFPGWSKLVGTGAAKNILERCVDRATDGHKGIAGVTTDLNQTMTRAAVGRASGILSHATTLGLLTTTEATRFVNWQCCTCDSDTGEMKWGEWQNHSSKVPGGPWDVSTMDDFEVAVSDFLDDSENVIECE